MVIYDQLSTDQQICYDKVLEESKKLLLKNPSYIEHQARLTALKLALKTLNRRGLQSQTLESYTNSIVGNKTIERLDEITNISSELDAMYESLDIDKTTLKTDILDIKSKNQISDKDVLKLMISLQEGWKGREDFGFNQSDYAIAAFLARVGNGSSISNYVYDVLKDLEFDNKGVESKKNNIAKSIKEANDNLRSDIYKLVASSHEKYEDECLVKDDGRELSQIYSVLNLTCKERTEDIFNSALLASIKSIKKEIDFQFKTPKRDSISRLNYLQDKLNEKSDLEKIIGFHKNKFIQNPCSGYSVVDKKNGKMLLYSNNGELVLEDKALLGDSNRADKKLFNPDSRLRRFGNGTYTRTTGAGIYYTKKDINNRVERKYDQEFNDRVIALSYKDSNGDFKEEKILALHSVPNIGWIKNRDVRLKSLDKEKLENKLTTGCVNITGLTHDITNQYLGDKCPVYILPEDEENFFFIKNNELLFTTKNNVKRLGLEKSKKLVDGQYVDDENNQSIVKYNSSSNEVKFSKLKTYQSSKLDEFITISKEQGLYGHDDLMDIVSLAVVLEKSGQVVELEKLQASFQKVSDTEDYNYLSSSKRRALILGELEEQNTDVDILVSTSKGVEFE